MSHPPNPTPPMNKRPPNEDVPIVQTAVRLKRDLVSTLERIYKVGIQLVMSQTSINNIALEMGALKLEPL